MVHIDKTLNDAESYKAYWAIETSKNVIVERMKQLGGDEFSENEFNTLRRVLYLFTTIGQQLLSVNERFHCKATQRTVFGEMANTLHNLTMSHTDMLSVLLKWDEFLTKADTTEEDE